MGTRRKLIEYCLENSQNSMAALMAACNVKTEDAFWEQINQKKIKLSAVQNLCGLLGISTRAFCLIMEAPA